MPQPDIIVTAPLPPFLYDPLKADYRCHDYHAASHKPGLLAAEGGRIRGLVQGGGTVTPTSLLDALPKLEIISVFGVGYDGVPVEYCRERGLKVTNTPDVLTDDVADVALGLILMTGRGFVRLNRFAEAREWEQRGPELTTKLGGRRVGIIGLGRIGKAVVRRAKAFEMRILVDDIKPDHDFIKANGLELVDKDTIFRESDIVSLHCSASPDTADLINARTLGLMKPTAFLVNAARGSMVDEQALTDALDSGRIAGAGLDVFKKEPPAGSPLLKAKNAIFTPHAAGGNKRAIDAAMTIAADNILAVARGGRPRDDLVVNPEVWQRPRRP